MNRQNNNTNHRPEPHSTNLLFLPWFVTTRSFVYWWIVLAVLLLAGVASLFLRVPIYSSGTGIIADWRAGNDAQEHRLVVVAFFPAPMVSHLTPGQTLSVDLGDQKLSRPIIEARPKPLDRSAAAGEFALNTNAASSISDLSAVAIVQLETIPALASPQLTAGRVVKVNYLLNTRRLGSFFPFIGGFFHD